MVPVSAIPMPRRPLRVHTASQSRDAGRKARSRVDPLCEGDGFSTFGNLVTAMSTTTINESSQTLATVGDESGNLQLATQDVAAQVPWTTYENVTVSDSLDRFMHYFPDSM
jgi:hypothetical protein